MVGEEDIYGKLIASDDEHASVGWEPAVISSQFGSNSISFIQQRLLGLEQMLVALLLQSSRLNGTGGQAVNDRPHALADESLQPTDVRGVPDKEHVLKTAEDESSGDSDCVTPPLTYMVCEDLDDLIQDSFLPAREEGRAVVEMCPRCSTSTAVLRERLRLAARLLEEAVMRVRALGLELSEHRSNDPPQHAGPPASQPAIKDAEQRQIADELAKMMQSFTDGCVLQLGGRVLKATQEHEARLAAACEHISRLQEASGRQLEASGRQLAAAAARESRRASAIADLKRQVTSCVQRHKSGALHVSAAVEQCEQQLEAGLASVEAQLEAMAMGVSWMQSEHARQQRIKERRCRQHQSALSYLLQMVSALCRSAGRVRRL